jgi:DHA3 family macrolide efflux protein-like MFS transporter
MTRLAIRVSDEFRILAGLVLSNISAGVLAIAVPLLVYDKNKNLTQAAMVALVGLVPALVVGIMGAPQLDRLDRRVLIIASNLIRGTLIFGVYALWHVVGVPGLMFVAFISSGLGALEKPALRSSLPMLFGDRYQEFVGKRAGLSFAVQAIAPIMGGALVGIFGSVPTLGWCAVGYALYGMVAFSFPKLNDVDHGRPGQQSTREPLKESLVFASKTPAVRTLLVYWLVSFTAVPLGTLTAVPYITNSLGKSSFEYGVASACYGTASVISSIVAGKLKFPGGVRKWLIGTGLVYGMVNLVMVWQPPYVIFCLLWIMWGLGYGPEEVATQVLFAKVVRPDMSGRLFSLMNVVMTLASFIGMIMVGPLSDNLGPTISMAIAGLIFIGATLASFAFGDGAKAISAVVMHETV